MSRKCQGDPGTCGFCGYGEGWLGEQGDERTQQLHSAVRSGKPGDYTYESHPNAHGCQTITWCGDCVGGLMHKWQRYDDTNLRALFLSTKLRLELDGPRWTLWETSPDTEEGNAVRQYGDDVAIHMDKLRLERDLRDMELETFRRYGHDLVASGRMERP